VPVYDLQLAPIDGSAPSRLLSTGYDKLATSVSPDGKTVAYLEVAGPDRIMFAPIAGGAPTPLEARPATQRNGAFSPDGRWLAYEETGLDRRPEVYVRALDGQGARHQVSADGGDQPLWSRGGREIVYRKGDAVLSASFDPATGEAGTPTVLFRKPDAGRLNGGRTVGYDVTPDGSRFLLVTPVQRADAQPTVVIVNWIAELRAKMPR
jgi:Tol biopolymer transport system component